MYQINIEIEMYVCARSFNIKRLNVVILKRPHLGLKLIYTISDPIIPLWQCQLVPILLFYIFRLEIPIQFSNVLNLLSCSWFCHSLSLLTSHCPTDNDEIGHSRWRHASMSVSVHLPSHVGDYCEQHQDSDRHTYHHSQGNDQQDPLKAHIRFKCCSIDKLSVETQRIVYTYTSGR